MAIGEAVEWKPDFLPGTRDDGHIRCPEWIVLHYVLTHEALLLRLLHITGIHYRHFTFLQPSPRRAGKPSTRRWFKGYLFVEVDLALDRWQQVLNMPGAIRFLGEPSPITIEQMDLMESVCCETVKRGDPGAPFKPGDDVRIIDGPFASFYGVVRDVRMNKRVATVVAMIFGRPADVLLHFTSLEPMS